MFNNYGNIHNIFQNNTERGEYSMNKYEYVYILTSSPNTIWNIIIKLIENQFLLISN